MGTLNWTYNELNGWIASFISKALANNNLTMNGISDKYETISRNAHIEAISGGTVGNVISLAWQGTYLYCSNGSTTESPTGHLIYELATPTEETAQPYTEYQKVSKYGTEEYVSTGIVPVGHVTKYPADIVSKVDGLPSDFSTLIAPTESAMKATRNYSVNQFLIVNNQLYKVTSAIASGATITVGSNVTATTIADVLTTLLNA